MNPSQFKSITDFVKCRYTKDGFAYSAGLDTSGISTNSSLTSKWTQLSNKEWKLKISGTWNSTYAYSNQISFVGKYPQIRVTVLSINNDKYINSSFGYIAYSSKGLANGKSIDVIHYADGGTDYAYYGNQVNIYSFNKGYLDSLDSPYVECELLFTVTEFTRANITQNQNFNNNGAQLNYERLKWIIEDLQPTTTTKTLTLGSTLLSQLTDEDKKIATDKGWTLA